jgi:Holliday junction resolvase RusA-like endonuclease
VRIVAYGIAAPGGSKTIGRNRHGGTWIRDASKRSGDWKRTVAQAAGGVMAERELLEGALELRVVFHLPRPRGHYGKRGLRPSAPGWPTARPDTTKLLRAVEDALTGIVWRDDAQIVRQHAEKRYAESVARVEVEVGMAPPTNHRLPRLHPQERARESRSPDAVECSGDSGADRPPRPHGLSRIPEAA